MPTSPADLMLRMVNHMVDSYLELRRLLTKQLDHCRRSCSTRAARLSNWSLLLDSRNALHLLDDICEDQRAAIVDWIDALEEWPEPNDDAQQRERELLRVRSRDVLEHIERVLRTCAGSKRRPRPRCRCTSRSRATAPTTSCAR